MPTPVDILLSPAALVTTGLFAGLMLWEAVAPARMLPAVRGWRLKGIAALVAYLLIAGYLPLVWDSHLARFQFLDLAHLPVWAGAAIGFLVYETVAYAYHRSLHRVTPLWRALHQMHHSSERIDVASAFWFSPLDAAGWTFVGSVALVLGVGLAPEAAREHPHAALARLRHRAAREPRAAPRARRPCVQLRGPAADRHAGRHVPQPARLPRGHRLLGRRVVARARHAALP